MRQESKGNITGLNSKQVVKIPGLQSQRMAGLFGILSKLLGLSLSWLSPLQNGQRKEYGEKKNMNLLSFYYILNHYNIHHRYSLNLIKTTTLETLHYFTDADGEATVIGDCGQ